MLFGRATAGTGRGEELSPADVRTLLSVYTISQTDTAISVAVAALVDSSPAALDTLNELAAALGDDANFASTVTTSLAGKQATLISGTNIKTINSTSLLGSGDIAISADPAGSSGAVQYNNAGAFGGATAIAYAGSGTHVLITAQASTTIPLCARAAASHSVAIQEWQTSAGVPGFFVRSDCNPHIAGVGRVYFGNNDLTYIHASHATANNGLTIVAASRIINFSSSGIINSSAGKLGGLFFVGGAGGHASLVANSIEGLKVDGNTTAGETPLLVYDITAATLQRVSIGAADSGGAGFRVLRVPN